MINFKDRRLLLNERNEFVFKYRQKGKFELSCLGATEAHTLDKNRDIDFGCSLLEIITFIPVITRIIWCGGYVEKEILGTLEINSQLVFFFNFWSGKSPLTISGLIKRTRWVLKGFF